MNEFYKCTLDNWKFPVDDSPIICSGDCKGCPWEEKEAKRREETPMTFDEKTGLLRKVVKI